MCLPVSLEIEPAKEGAKGLLPSALGGYGGPPPGNFENFNSIWCTLVKSRGSFIQKETTIKEKKLYMRRHFVIYHPLILGLYIILFYF